MKQKDVGDYRLNPLVSENSLRHNVSRSNGTAGTYSCLTGKRATASTKERLRGLLEQVLLTRLLYGQLSLAEKGVENDVRSANNSSH